MNQHETHLKFDTSLCPATPNPKAGVRAYKIGKVNNAARRVLSEPKTHLKLYTVQGHTTHNSQAGVRAHKLEKCVMQRATC